MIPASLARIEALTALTGSESFPCRRPLRKDAVSGWEYYLLLWVLPLVTVAKTLTHFRNVVEHAQLRDVGDPELSRYRTVLCNPAEGFFFAPMNFNYHAEHHLYTGIPYHRLPRCHALLREHPRYLEVVEVEKGYLSFLFNKLQETAA